LVLLSRILARILLMDGNVLVATVNMSHWEGALTQTPTAQRNGVELPQIDPC